MGPGNNINCYMRSCMCKSFAFMHNISYLFVFVCAFNCVRLWYVNFLLCGFPLIKLHELSLGSCFGDRSVLIILSKPNPGTLPCCVNSGEILSNECVMAFFISRWLEEWADFLLHISLRSNCIPNKSWLLQCLYSFHTAS
jgi:hypothetical protein